MDYIETVFKISGGKTLALEKIHRWYFFIWTDTEENLDTVLEDLRKFCPNLRFTYEKSREKISFFDVVIKIKDGKITTNLFCKITNGHQYLHYDSCHAEHIKRSLVFSQTLRLKIIRSEKRDLVSNVENLREWFRVNENQVARALQSASNNSANRSKQWKETGISLVTTYHPRLKDLSSLIKRSLQYLYSEVNNVFIPAPFVSFRSVRNLKSFLIRSNFYPLKRKTGSEKCNGKRCLVCLKVA